MEYILGYGISSEKLLDIGKGLMMTVFVLTVVVFVQITIKRGQLMYRDFRRKRFLDLWRPILMESVAVVPEKLPKLDQTFFFDFIAEWNSLYEKLGGMSHDNLIELARKTGIVKKAGTLLISSNIRMQLVGIITLGNLRSEGAWPFLASIAKNGETTLSMAAYRALAQIDVNRALEELLPQLVSRTDWPVSMVAKILKEAKNPVICELLEEASYKASENELPNIIRYMNVLNCPNSTKVFKTILDKQVDDQIISLCLHEISDPFAIDLVHQYVDYPRWHVRVNVAHALGKIGGKDDVPILVKLLQDKQWWVRYRAAEALVSLPFLKPDEIEDIQESLTDNFARDILIQAVAEKEMR